MERSKLSGSLITAEKKYKKSYTALLLTVCFLIPAAIMLVTYAIYGMAPFGEKSILIMDMSNQYCEFYCGLKHIGSMGDLFFSWSKALGGNYIGVFAYYLSSPLSVFTLFWPNTEMPICLLYLTCIKIGLCGLTFGIFLNKRHQRKGAAVSRTYIALFSVCYAMMSYNIVYSLSLMWVDAVIFLPLIALGIDYLIYDGRWGLLLLSFLGIFISTYYISYMAGIFSCMYLLYAIAEREALSRKQTGKIILKFIGSAVGAAALGAWLLVPTFFSLLQGKIGGNNYTNGNVTYYDPASLLKKLIIGTYDGITFEVTPFLYCGILVFILFFAYFFLKSVSARRKIIAAAILLFLLLSTLFVRIDWAWHIFQLPNWFPYRYSFAISFLMVFVAAEAFRHFKEIKYTYYCTFVFIAVSVYLVFYLNPKFGITKQQVRYSITFLLFGMIFLLLLKYLPERFRFRNKQIKTYVPRGAVWFLILCMTSCELSIHADYLLHGLDSVHHYESYESYYQYKKRMEELVRAAERDDAKTGGSGFYRIVQGFQRNFNEGIGMGYQSISHFSSAYNRHINTFLHKLGFAQTYLWSSCAGSTTVTDALFSVKYVMTDDMIAKKDPEKKILTWNPLPMNQYERVRRYDDTILYRNQYLLAPCYAASAAVKEFDWGDNPLDSQNRLMNALMNDQKQYFVKLQNGREYTESKLADCTTYLLTMPYSGPLYAYLPKGSQGETPPETPLIINYQYEISLYEGETDCVLFLGNYEKGDVVTLSIMANSELLKTTGNVFYVLDLPVFEEAVQTLRRSQISISDWGADYLEGSLTAGENQVVFTGITYDEGWRVSVDGQEVRTQCFADGLLYFDVTPGFHEIALRYSARGERTGFAVTAVSCVVAAVYLPVFLIKRKRKRSIDHGAK